MGGRRKGKEMERGRGGLGEEDRQPARCPGSLEYLPCASNFSHVVSGCILLQFKCVSGFIRTQVLIYNPPCQNVLLAESWR